MTSLPPGIILIIGGLLLPILRGRWQQVWLLLLPLLSGGHLLFQVFTHWDVIYSEAGFQIPFSVFGYDLAPIHIDPLSLVWGYIFHIAAFVCALYSLHVKDSVQHVSALIYIGGAIGAVFAGDLITLFVYWELTAISSVFLIWASRSERSYRAGMRYLIVQVGSGVLLLAGILLHFRDTGSLAFNAFHALLPSSDGLYLGLNSLGTSLIFLAFGIKAAFPFLHTWLTDAYPEATPTGTVVLSAITTKLAIYALARGFPGTELLIYIGAGMAVFPMFFAVIENDLRRVLAYSLIVQLGYMVVGVGLADFEGQHAVAELAINGTAAHAFVHVLYKSLLFMAIGAVLMRTGTSKISDLGGLYKSMPLTTTFCSIAAASLAAFPLFSGFISKPLILAATVDAHHLNVWLLLMFASACTLIYSALRVPFFAFFGRDSGRRVEEAPVNMLVAMGGAAAACVAIGIIPGALYALLPWKVEHEPVYSVEHIITQLQVLFWSMLAFVVLYRTGLMRKERATISLDFDWFFRRPFTKSPGRIASPTERLLASLGRVRQTFESIVSSTLTWVRDAMCELVGPLGKTRSISAMVIWVAIFLTAYLLLFYLNV